MCKLGKDVRVCKKLWERERERKREREKKKKRERERERGTWVQEGIERKCVHVREESERRPSTMSTVQKVTFPNQKTIICCHTTIPSILNTTRRNVHSGQHTQCEEVGSTHTM